MWNSCHSTFSSWNVSSRNTEWLLSFGCLTWTSSKYKAHLYFLCAKKLWRCNLFWQTEWTRVILLWYAVKNMFLFRSGNWETFHIKHAKDNRSRHAHWWWVRPGLENITFYLPLSSHTEPLLQPDEMIVMYTQAAVWFCFSVCGTHMRKWCVGRRNTSMLHIKPPRHLSYLRTSVHFLFLQGGRMQESQQPLCTDHIRATSWPCSGFFMPGKQRLTSIYFKWIPFIDM